jgi:hypothetical protein
MSLKPPIVCPPDWSILAFRISECKLASVVKGVNKLAALDLNNLYIPIAEHIEGSLTLKGGTERLLNIDDIAEYGPLNEQFSFNALLADNPNIFADETIHEYSLYDENLNFLESLSFTIDVNDPDYSDFSTALATAYGDSTVIKSKVTFDASTALSTGVLTVRSITRNVKLRHLFTFDTSGVDLQSPGTLLTPYTKYPKGRVKYILVFPDYDKVDVTTCGCANASGDMKSNQKFFQYVNRGEYDEVNNPDTNVVFAVPSGTGPSVNTSWHYTTVSDHIGYHFSVNDLMKVDNGVPFRANIEYLNGKDIELDAPVATSYDGELMSNVYGPATPKWRNVGDFLFLSGATDIEDTDRCFIETIVLKNPHTFDIPLRYMIGR